MVIQLSLSSRNHPPRYISCHGPLVHQQQQQEQEEGACERKFNVDLLRPEMPISLLPPNLQPFDFSTHPTSYLALHPTPNHNQIFCVLYFLDIKIPLALPSFDSSNSNQWAIEIILSVAMHPCHVIHISSCALNSFAATCTTYQEPVATDSLDPLLSSLAAIFDHLESTPS